jgi:hypothetical protein
MAGKALRQRKKEKAKRERDKGGKEMSFKEMTPYWRP